MPFVVLAKMGELTNSSWTAPQKHVAVASFSCEYPSLAPPASGKYGLDVSGEEGMMSVDSKMGLRAGK